MWIDAAITHLYSLVGLVVITGYIPQIIKLANSTGRSLAISIPTFLLWTASAAISLGYGLLVLRDWRFCLIESINVLGCVTIITLTIYNRYFRFPHLAVPKVQAAEPEPAPDMQEDAGAAEAESGLT